MEAEADAAVFCTHETVVLDQKANFYTVPLFLPLKETSVSLEVYINKDNSYLHNRSICVVSRI